MDHAVHAALAPPACDEHAPALNDRPIDLGVGTEKSKDLRALGFDSEELVRRFTVVEWVVTSTSVYDGIVAESDDREQTITRYRLFADPAFEAASHDVATVIRTTDDADEQLLALVLEVAFPR